VNVDHQLERLDELIIPLVSARAPGLLAPYGIGPHTAALRLIAAEDHPGRLRSEAAWGAPVRGRPDPGIVRESHPPPAQLRRRPPGQPGPVADRVHPPCRACRSPRGSERSSCQPGSGRRLAGDQHITGRRSARVGRECPSSTAPYPLSARNTLGLHMTRRIQPARRGPGIASARSAGMLRSARLNVAGSADQA
jgi:hypothetical protein